MENSPRVQAIFCRSGRDRGEREREGEQKGGRRQRDDGFVRWINSGIKMAKL